MEVIILPSPEDVAMAAARIVSSLVQREPDAVLGLPTGETPKPFYRELVRAKLDLSRVTTFNLDEYVGLPNDHPDSFHRYMDEHFLQHVKVNAHLPNGLADDLAAECTRYEAQIRAAGGMDLCVLGLGKNGHIGFNEPTSALTSRTRMKTLIDGRHAITMGIGTIMEARRCLLLATGTSKADAVRQMVEGPLTAMVPASALQQHGRATVLVDEAAAEKLTLKDYFRTIHSHKPAWQKQRDGV